MLNCHNLLNINFIIFSDWVDVCLPFLYFKRFNNGKDRG
jgi:hypothetical protein